MGHEELKEIGINAYGHRHKLIKGIERLLGGQQGECLSHKTPKCCSCFFISLKSCYLYAQVPTHTWRSTAPIRAQFWSTWPWMIKSFNLLRKRYKQKHLSSVLFHTPVCFGCVMSVCLFLWSQMQSTIREHRDGGNAGGIFSRYNVIKVKHKMQLF